MNMLKRFLALLLVACMMLAAAPVSAFAAEVEPTGESTQAAEVEETTAPTTVPETVSTETTEATASTESTVGTVPEESNTDDETLPEEALFLTDGIAVQALTMGEKPADGTTTGNPFPKGTAGSNSFRIPAMVTLNSGAIVAAADARWNTTFDGGGLDTIVSRSYDNGATWRYTFANYLGDNGNEYNGSGSTAFIDPCLATDGSTVYMLCDLYPYGVALNGNGNTAPSTAVGFNSDGTLKLAKSGSSSYDYYLKDGRIYDSNGNVDSNYTVDEYFNIKDSYGSTSNLFFSNSPYQVVRTGYLYLTSSTDGGATWSAPTLIPNVKTAYERVCLVGPGRGLVTGGRIIFPVYSYSGSATSQRMGFIYSTDGGASWKRVDSGISWSSEAAVVELDDGTLRFFYRNGTSSLCYVDYNWNTGWGSAVDTNIATNSNTQISAISYSGRVSGKQVILVSCPAGSGSNGSADSSASSRTNGKIFVGLVNSDNSNSMDWQTDKTVSLNSQHSSNNFMYSCMTELSDGRVAVLYEDHENLWGVGSNCYYQMTYANIDASSFGLTFDAAAPTTRVFRDEATGVEVTVTAKNGESLDGWTLKVTPNQSVDGVSGSYAAYDISLTDASSAAQTVTGASVSLPVGNLDTSNAAPFTVSDGTVAELNGTFSEDGKAFSFTADLPGTFGLAENSMVSPSTETKDIVLTVGQSQTVTDETGDYEASYTGEGLDATIATAKVTGTTVGGTAAIPERKDKVTDLTAGTYIIGNGTQWLTLNGSSLSSTTDPTKATEWTIAENIYRGTTYWTIQSGDYYLYYSSYSGSLSASSYYSTNWSYDGNGFYCTSWRTTYYLLWSGSAWQVSTSSSNRGAAYTYTPATEGTEGKASTDITFTGVSAGTTSVVVGNTRYNITVNRKTETVNLTVGNTASYPDIGTPEVKDSTVASAVISGGTLTITGLAEGTTTVTTDTTVYTVNVAAATPLSVPQGSSTTISVTLENGQYVKWSSADSSYAGVAGVYNTSSLAYTNEANVFGQRITETPVEVTGTIYNSDGSVASVEKWLVTVTPPEGATSLKRYFDVDQVENCILYYSINGGQLIPVNGSGVYIIPDNNDDPYKVIDGEWYGDLSLMFFAAPEDGYALTQLFVEKSADQYYVLSDGEGDDVTKSSAWPFLDGVDPNSISYGGRTYSVEEIAALRNAGNENAYQGVKNSGSIWKNIGGLHGFRWALLEGYMTPSRMKALFEDARSKGCTGVTTVTKGSSNNDNTGSAANPISICAVAQKLATIDKEVVQLTAADGSDITQSGIVKIGDTVIYKVTMTVPATSSVVKYWNGTRLVSGDTSTISYTNISVADSLSGYANGFNWTRTSATSQTSGADQTYSVTYTVTLTAENFSGIVTEGTITNVASLSYDYTSSFGKGSHKSSAEKQLDVTVEIPSYVVDFGLPVDIDLTGRIPSSGRIIACEDGSYGTATVNTNGSGLIYTPTAILQGVDYINFTYRRPDNSLVYGYKVAIYPATTVYYEEGFAAYSGSWTGYSKGRGTQAAQILGSSNDAYGYDSAYSTGLGASGGTCAVSETVGDSCSFTFTGTGFEIYADCATGSGYLSSVVVRDENNTAVKAYLVNTVAANGETDATADQATDLYGLPIISEQNLTYGTYKITVTHIINQKPIYIDGIRIYGTMGENTAIYQGDGENSPTFIELRDQVLASLGATDEDSQQYADQIASNLHSQVYDMNGNTQGAIITSDVATTGYTEAVLTDLLDNGPKNEIFLRRNQSLTFAVTTSGKIQVGLKAPTRQTSYRIQSDGSSVNQTIATSTDMFYTVPTAGTSARHTVTITNTGDGILSVTKLKVCGDSNAMLDTLAGDDLIPAMESLGFARKPDATKPSTPDPVNPAQPEKPDVPKEPETPDVPAQPEQPSVSYADAALTVILVDYTGTPVSTAMLTANGEEHKTHSFTAQALRSAAEGAMPSGYAFVEEDAIPSADVNYGEEGTVKIQVGKVAVLNVTYINILGRKIGTATITEVQTSAGSCRISASEIREVAPNGRRAIWLTSVKVPFGSERSIIVSAF